MGKTLYVSDLDGTLMQPGAFISDTAKALLNRSIADGKLFTIATARTPATVSGIIKDVNMNIPAIVLTGAAVWDPATNTYSNPKFIKPEVVEKLVDTYHEMNFPIFLFTLDKGILNIYHIGGKLTPLEQQFMDERIHSPFKRFHVREDGKEILPPDFNSTIIFYGMQPTDPAQAVHLQTSKIAGCRPQCYHDLYGPTIALVDAFAPDATKANAIIEMKKHTGADKVIAFGDNLNDIPMLKAADVAIAVENALPEVKEVADIIIGPNTEDSVAKFIYENE